LNAAIGASALALLLSGCRLQGTVEMVAPEEIRVDLTFNVTSDECSFEAGQGYFGLEAEAKALPDGTVDCRLAGTVSADRLTEIYPTLVATDVGEYDLLATNFAYEIDGIDVLVTMPGQVVSASFGEVSGNQVHITTDRVVLKPLKIVARAQPGSQWWPAWWAGGGLLAGAGMVGAGWLLRRRRNGASFEPQEETFDLTPEAEPVIGQGWHAPPPETRHTAEPADQFRAPPPVVDNSFWAPPPQDGPESP